MTQKTIIEQACINIHLFPNGSWDKIISDKLMQEALRLFAKKIDKELDIYGINTCEQWSTVWQELKKRQGVE